MEASLKGGTLCTGRPPEHDQDRVHIRGRDPLYWGGGGLYWQTTWTWPAVEIRTNFLVTRRTNYIGIQMVLLMLRWSFHIEPTKYMVWTWWPTRPWSSVRFRRSDLGGHGSPVTDHRSRTTAPLVILTPDALSIKLADIHCTFYRTLYSIIHNVAEIIVISIWLIDIGKTLIVCAHIHVYYRKTFQYLSPENYIVLWSRARTITWLIGSIT